MTIGAREVNFTIADISDSEVFPIEDFREFRIRLINYKGKAEIVDFAEWVEKHKDYN